MGRLEAWSGLPLRLIVTIASWSLLAVSFSILLIVPAFAFPRISFIFGEGKDRFARARWTQRVLLTTVVLPILHGLIVMACDNIW